MDERTIRRMTHAGGVFVLVTAAIHLTLGVVGLYDPAVLDVDGAALPASFVVAALAGYALVGAYATGRVPRTTAAAIGAVVLTSFVVAYADWHGFGYAETLLQLEPAGVDHQHSQGAHDHSHGVHDHSNDGPPLVDLVNHLRSDPYALASKTAELVGAVLLAVVALSD